MICTSAIRTTLLVAALTVASIAHARTCHLKVIWPGGAAEADPARLEFLASVLQHRLTRGAETGLLGAHAFAEGTHLVVRVKVPASRADETAKDIKATAEAIAETGASEPEFRTALHAARVPVTCSRDELQALARRYFSPGNLSVVSRRRSAARRGVPVIPVGERTTSRVLFLNLTSSEPGPLGS